MKKLAVALSKGGVGKTTTCVNLAAALAGGGCRVLLVDTDSQGHAADLLGLAPAVGLGAVMRGELRAVDALATARRNLWLLAGGEDLAGVRHQLSSREDDAHMALSQALAPLEGSFDVVVLDTAPGWDPMLINVLFYADHVLSPVACEVLALRGLADFSQKLGQVSLHRSISLDHVLPTFVDGRVRKTAEIIEQLQRHFGDKLCRPIHYNVKLSEAAGFGQTIQEYAPHSRGALDYQLLAERVLSRGST